MEGSERPQAGEEKVTWIDGFGLGCCIGFVTGVILLLGLGLTGLRPSGNLNGPYDPLRHPRPKPPVGSGGTQTSHNYWEARAAVQQLLDEPESTTAKPSPPPPKPGRRIGPILESYEPPAR